MTIFVGQGMTKSRYLKIFKSQYLLEFMQYDHNFFKGFMLRSRNLGLQGLIRLT